MVFEEVLASVRADLAARQTRTPLAEVKARALAQPSAKDGVRALRGEGVAVIAEVRASCPSKDILAGEYEQGGANVISVPVGSGRSGGSLQDLRDVCARVEVPVLCKDLIVSSYQLWEARAHGADLVLLVAAALEQGALVSLIERAESIGLTALVEVRDGPEVVRAVGAGARIIAVNAPDLRTPQVDREALARLVELIPDGAVRVAECGSAGRLDLIACAKAGADAVLVGQSLLAGKNPRATVAGLVAAGAHPALWRGRRQAA
jgi:indole-3-glycerol phosphate synthase